MTLQEIRNAINADVALLAFAIEGNTQAIADVLSVGRTKFTSSTITTRGAAAEFPTLAGLPGALAFQLAYRKLIAFAAAAKASETLSTSLLGEAIELQITSFRDLGLDFSSAALRGMLDIITASGGITADEANGFKGLATSAADPILEFTVRQAIFADDGTLLVGA